MKLAVTGATGFVGSHLVRHLLDKGHEVIGMSHRRPEPQVGDRRIEWRQGSIDDVSSMVKVFEGAEAVFHLVGIIAESGGKTFTDIVARGTSHMVEASRRAGVKLVVYQSAMGTEPDSSIPYRQTKYQAERTIKNSGLDFVILRPSIIYGPGDGFVSLLSKMIRLSPIVPLPGGGHFELQPVYIDDMNRCLERSLHTPEVRSIIIEVGGPEKLEYRRIVNILIDTMNRRRITVPMPMPLMRIGATLSEHLLRKPPLTRDQLRMLQSGNTGDISLMRKLFDIEPVRFNDGLAAYMR